LEDGVTDLEQARRKTGASIGYPGWGILYYATACALEPGTRATILETGTNWGSSTIVLASALRAAPVEGIVHTIEIEQENAAIARHRFKQAGLDDLIVSHLGDTRKVLPALVKELDEIAVVFLDGGHTFDLVKTEFECILPKLKRRGIVMFDNTYQIAAPGQDQRVNGFLKWLPGAHGGNLINLPYCSWFTPGLAIWQREAF
jgi:predicted O-methyltransferase YrrM